MTTVSSAQSKNFEEIMAKIYDIPKNPVFTNKSLTAFFQSNGYKGASVQIKKDSKNDENSKPFWSATIKFKS